MRYVREFNTNHAASGERPLPADRFACYGTADGVRLRFLQVLEIDPDNAFAQQVDVASIVLPWSVALQLPEHLKRTYTDVINKAGGDGPEKIAVVSTDRFETLVRDGKIDRQGRERNVVQEMNRSCPDAPHPVNECATSATEDRYKEHYGGTPEPHPDSINGLTRRLEAAHDELKALCAHRDHLAKEAREAERRLQEALNANHQLARRLDAAREALR
jgi:hypothetical protein